MENPSILIINLSCSQIEGQLINELNLVEGIEYFVLNYSDYRSIDLRFSPSLIIVIVNKNDHEILDSETLNELPTIYPATPIISIIDTQLGFEKFRECQKFSWGFLTTPLSSNDIKLLINWYAKNYRENPEIPFELLLKQQSINDFYIGKSKAALEIIHKINQIASYNITVLLQGETGTGKELCAKLIHYLSNRSQNPFVAVNCGAVPVDLFENELFGHKKGAYTHAETTENGLVFSANKGTLFLDEIEALPLSAQVKLLRFIEEKTYRPLGQNSSISADIRLIAATNKDLKDLIIRGNFREDLFFRLSSICISVPSLREKREDIPLLVDHFIKRFSTLYEKEVLGIKPDALMKLVLHNWSGNVREMENIIRQAVIMNNNEWIGVENLDFNIYSTNQIIFPGSFQKEKMNNIKNFEKNYLATTLNIFKGNVSQAAKFAQKDRREFYRLIKKYKLDPEFYRSTPS